jgi:Tol biopolymer transport system component
MTLPAGTKLGPYDILSPLGAGGMGEVYRARDPRLGREVAVKVLPAEMSADPNRLARFEQEARAASALNHPGIVTIYEIGRSDSIPYIAMELVSGKTLRDLLAEGAIPPKRALTIAAHTADALARAHEAGIVHRDLKPENVMVVRDGLVKVLDFGLAKLMPGPETDLSQSPTAIEPTHPGVVLGTVSYMSPEQASGKAVDFRSDQFSLGSILYEMATGQRAFARGTTAESLVAIIKDEPEPPPALLPQAPAPLRWVIERCLAKDPDERYASTRDLARDLARLRDYSGQTSSETAAAAPRRRRGGVVALAAAAAATVAAGLLGALVGRGRPEAPPARPIRFSVPIPDGTLYAPAETSRGFSVSPDGTRFGIEAYSQGRRRLFVRPLGAEQATELEGSLDATAHFWSPDSRFIAFYADGKLKKIPAAGGPAQTICGASIGFIGSWNRDGTILFTMLSGDPGIYRVSDTGGPPTLVPKPEKRILLWPHFLPDGRRYLFVGLSLEGRSAEGWDLGLGQLESSESLRVGTVDSRVEYASPGTLLFARDGALFAQPFDERSGRLGGEPRRIVESLHFFNGPAHAAFSVSSTGVLAYQAAARPSRLVWFDRAGKTVSNLGEPGLVSEFRISPDGGRVAVGVGRHESGTSDIWLHEIARGVSTRLHADTSDQIAPVWQPDGARLIYRSDRMGPPDIFEITVGAPGSDRPLLQGPGVQQPEDVSPDGGRLLYLNAVRGSDWDIWIAPLGKDGTPKPWLESRFSEASPRFSPDGRWIAYESDESGEPEVYAALTEGGGGKRRLSPSGGRLPRWRRDGRELTYVAPNGLIMSIPVTAGSRGEFGVPVPLFRVESVVENYDVSPDGTRFLVRMPAENSSESPLRVILNWPALLEETAP